MVSSENSMLAVRKARSAKTQAPGLRGGRSPIALIVVGLAALLLGATIGIFFMRQRSHARMNEPMLAVNGVTLGKLEFYRRLEQAAGMQVAREMIGEELTFQYSRKMGTMPTTEAVEARYKEISKTPEFQKALALSGQSEDDARRMLRLNMTRTSGIGKGVTVTDADIKKFYAINIDKKNLRARYYKPESIQIAALVTKNEAELQSAMTEMRAGVSFQSAVKKYSVDVSKATNGIQPPIVRGRNNMGKVPGMEKALFSMKIGQQMGPRRFAGLWWYIKCLDREKEKTVPFEEVKNECREGAMLLKGLPANYEKVQKDFQDFQATARIMSFKPQYQSLASSGKK